MAPDVSKSKAMDLRLDSLYAVDGLKGYYEKEYTVRYPQNWLFDPRVQLMKMGQMQQGDVLTSSGRSVVKQRLGPDPDGAPQQIQAILGEPNAALLKLLTESIAPAGSNREADPLRAEVKMRAGNVYYEFEWRTRFESGFAKRTYSSAALGPVGEQGQRTLYTLTLVVPEDEAKASEGVIRDVPSILDGFVVASNA